MAIYSLVLKVAGASTAAYYAASVNAGEILAPAASVVPATASYTYFGFNSGLTMSVPAGTATASGMLVTTESVVSGSVIVSPPVNVPVVLSLYGGNLLGTFTVQPGQSGGAYSFPVSANEGVTADEARAFIDQHVPKER